MSTNSPSPATFGEPWPEYNDGLTYRDLVRSPDSGISLYLYMCCTIKTQASDCAGLTLIEYYSLRHQSSAPALG
ncbi:hypothetical protein HanLR1_Chr08g0272451 [Helianthus annuus]|nr:hypothetical protein HanLR1_Chr08g0272451 [Helianthus annuus]